jgi:hypothetical protein
MKDKKHIKRFNEATENLNISDVISSELSEGYYWVKLKDDDMVKTSNFLQNSGGWLVGFYMNGYILVNGFPYKLEKFEIDYKKIER